MPASRGANLNGNGLFNGLSSPNQWSDEPYVTEIDQSCRYLVATAPIFAPYSIDVSRENLITCRYLRYTVLRFPGVGHITARVNTNRPSEAWQCVGYNAVNDSVEASRIAICPWGTNMSLVFR